MKVKTFTTTYNIENRLTKEEIKLLAIKYAELYYTHRNDSTAFDRDYYNWKAELYKEAYQIASGRNYIKTIYYGKNGSNKLQTY